MNTARPPTLCAGDDALMPPGYYTQTVPALLRLEPRQLTAFRRAELDRFSEAARNEPELAGMVQALFDRLLPYAAETLAEDQSLVALLDRYGFDRLQHEQIRSDLRSGRIGLAQNRLPVNSQIEDVKPDDVFDATAGVPERYRDLGLEALAAGAVAVISLAGGTGSRWTKGAGVVKALNPFCKLGGRHRTFVEVHLAKSRQTGRLCETTLPHVFTTSYMTQQPIEAFLKMAGDYDYEGPLTLSPGRIVGLRLVPMARDLRFAWEEMPQQLLDEQAQKMQDSLHAALIGWARQMGEGDDYTDNVPMQCLHPVGHWYEVPNMLRNGTLARLIQDRPNLKYLMVHNIDTLGANADPALLGLPYRPGRRLDHRGHSPAHRGSGRWIGPLQRPGASNRGPGLAPRGDRVPSILLQFQHHLGRHRSTISRFWPRPGRPVRRTQGQWPQPSAPWRPACRPISRSRMSKSAGARVKRTSSPSPNSRSCGAI